MQQIIDKLTRLSFISLLLLISGSFPAYAVVNDFDKTVTHVPAFPMLDEAGNNVLDTGNPYSPKQTCGTGGCHDYEKIADAYHFDFGREEADDHYGKKRGLPHLVSPGYFGGYTCMGGSNPQVLAKKDNANAEDFADYGAAGWVQTCMNCHTGGGWTEKDRDGIRYDEKNVADIKPLDGDYYERHTAHDGTVSMEQWDWKKSGVVEVDCMVCHADFSAMKAPEGSQLREISPGGAGGAVRSNRDALAEEGFFREAGTAAIELMTNNNDETIVTFSRSEQTVISHGHETTGIGFDLDGAGKPILKWNAGAFTSNKQIEMPMLRFPDNDNCMACHRTSNSRRGFYGFGDDAVMTPETEEGLESTGVIVDDYKDDVHKGKVFTENNGIERTIDNCNACHAKEYYRDTSLTANLVQSHDFPKGNSDMDLRNDLDYQPNAMSCEYCHDEAVNNVVPSGHETMLEAHQELWKGNGDMAGYSADSLTKITKTHLDVVGCQTCHITNKKVGMLYRYRIAEDGQQKIIPYNPRIRYYWKDLTNERVLSKIERNAIFERGDDDNGPFGIIRDQETGAELGRVGGTEGRHGFRFNDPDTYEGVIAVKNAYESLLRKKGHVNPKMAMIWSESNEYIISHNTRPSPESMPCGDCHARKQDGSFSSLVSVGGVLGKENVKEVTQLPAKRLVDEGVIILDLEYMKVDADGKVTENVSDILSVTKVDPFMTLLRNSSAPEVVGSFAEASAEKAFSGIDAADKLKMTAHFATEGALEFYGNGTNKTVKGLMVAAAADNLNKALLPTYRVMLGALENAGLDAAKEVVSALGAGTLVSNPVYFRVQDSDRKLVEVINGNEMLLTIPYQGTKTSAADIKVISIDWRVADAVTAPVADIVAIKPASSDGSVEGYVIVKVAKTGFYFVAE